MYDTKLINKRFYQFYPYSHSTILFFYLFQILIFTTLILSKFIKNFNFKIIHKKIVPF